MKIVQFLIFISFLTVAWCSKLVCSGENQKFDPCGSCAPVCIGGYFIERERKNCNASCVCEKGFIMNDDNKICMPITDCTHVPKCIPGMEYNTCGSVCQDRCAGDSVLFELCTACCKPGCFCKYGSYLSEDGDCVKDCKTQIKMN